MGRSSDIPTAKRETIRSLRLQGKTHAQIAVQVDCSRSSVTKSLQNLPDNQRNRCGRKKTTSKRDNRALEKLAKKNRFKSTSELNHLWGQEIERSVSRSTTYRRLRDMGYRSRIAATKPLLNKKQKEKRLKWAREHQDWTAEDWDHVIFSDESRFCLSFGDQAPKVRRKPHERYDGTCIKCSVKFPQAQMVWGCMSAKGVGDLAFLKGNINATAYQEVIGSFLLPTIEEQFGDSDFIIQHDLAPAHAARSTAVWF